MAPRSTAHSTDRSASNSTRWLWLLLALSLIGWRVSSRVEQYKTSVAGVEHQAQVSFFDANERNCESINASRSHSRLVAEERADRLFPVAGLEPPPALLAYRSASKADSALPSIYVGSVWLFSNPPPASLT